jgi:SAM-dependent methyltransferase
MNFRSRLEISDIIVQYDLQSLQRLNVDRRKSLEICDSRYARSIIASIPHKDGFLCNEAVDKKLLQAHSELQRLWEEFFHAQRVANILIALVQSLRASGIQRKLLVVDVGCGIGYVLRWLSKHQILKDDISLMGVDFNETLIQQAQKLAISETLDVQFKVANAFELDEPADIFLSSGVLHHFQKDMLPQFFSQQGECKPLAFAHFDPQYNWATPIGSFLFHFSRMRTSLARYDGWLSAARAHPCSTLDQAARTQIHHMTLFRYNPPIKYFPLIRTMTGIIGIHPPASSLFEKNLQEPLRRIP